jgi:eukaryotic translation initiation factor 2C
VSYVPAAYYADRLCERGRHYLRRFFDDHEDLRNLDEAAAKQKAEDVFYQQGAGRNPWHANLNDTMFWM